GSLLLLTMTKTAYFEHFGFQTISRAEVPAAVQCSVQFQDTCPASAAVMRLDILGTQASRLHASERQHDGSVRTQEAEGIHKSNRRNRGDNLMSNRIEEVVRDRYGSLARSGLSSEHSGVRAVAEAFGYSTEELTSIPAEANMGLSCGNPTAYANLRPGETVVDLGSGGGLDVFLAAAKVGPEGRAIGIDMTPEMIELARRNAAKANDGNGYSNVEFHLATIDKLPLADNSVDCVISNCVINLAPDKPAVFREIARVLKTAARVAV